MPVAVPDNDYNVIILGFWLDSGLYDSGYSWSMLDSATRQDYISKIHAAGKKILISAYGGKHFFKKKNGEKRVSRVIFSL